MYWTQYWLWLGERKAENKKMRCIVWNFRNPINNAHWSGFLLYSQKNARIWSHLICAPMKTYVDEEVKEKIRSKKSMEFKSRDFFPSLSMCEEQKTVYSLNEMCKTVANTLRTCRWSSCTVLKEEELKWKTWILNLYMWTVFFSLIFLKTWFIWSNICARRTQSMVSLLNGMTVSMAEIDVMKSALDLFLYTFFFSQISCFCSSESNG